MHPRNCPQVAFHLPIVKIVDEMPSDTVASTGSARFSDLSTVAHTHRDVHVNSHSFFHLHLISDATGETLLAAGRAAAAQYKQARAIEHIYPLIRTERQLMKVFEDIEEAPGIVLYTIVDQDLARRIDEHCAALGLPYVSVIEPVLRGLPDLSRGACGTQGRRPARARRGVFPAHRGPEFHHGA